MEVKSTNMNLLKLYISVLLICCSLNGCRKFLDVEIGKELVGADQIFTNEETVDAAVIAMYSALGTTLHTASMAGFASDELYQHVPTENGAEAQNNAVTSQNGMLPGLWDPFYKIIYEANSLLEGLENAPAISPEKISQFRGEAYFMRAFCYFYLTNFFNDVPLVMTTDYRENILIGRSTQEKIYEQILSDLLKAHDELPDIFIESKRFRPNKFAAKALLARVYLYLEDWENAETYSSAVIGNAGYSLLDDPNVVFAANSTEMVWQLGNSYVVINTSEAYTFIVSYPPSDQPVMRKPFTDSFEEGDKRRENWVGSFSDGQQTWYFPFKYKLLDRDLPPVEFQSVLGLSEQYLIRAEARIHLENIAGGIGDLNVLRGKRRMAPTTEVPNPLPDISVTLSEEQALLAVEEERKHELFTEWAHRWFDLNRTGRAAAVLTALKGDVWEPADRYFPFPQVELERNPNL